MRVPVALMILIAVAGCAGTSTTECLTCSTYVYNGHVYRRTGFGSEAEKFQVARSFCAERGFYGEPVLGPPMRWADGLYYRINCPPPQTPSTVLPQPTINSSPTPGVSPSAGASFEQVKAKCSELGFAPGTERSGNCVLQLSK